MTGEKIDSSESETIEPRPSFSDEFARHAHAPSPGLLREFVDFLRHEKKWWLVPVIVVLLLVGAVVVLASTAAGPFIYPLF